MNYIECLISLGLVLLVAITCLIGGGGSDNPEVEYHNQWKQSILTGDAMEY